MESKDHEQIYESSANQMLKKNESNLYLAPQIIKVGTHCSDTGRFNSNEVSKKVSKRRRSSKPEDKQNSHPNQKQNHQEKYDVHADYFMKTFLKEVRLGQKQNQIMNCVKKSSFSSSIFVFSMYGQKIDYILKSNFFGSIYNLCHNNNIVMTLNFDVGFSKANQSRTFKTFVLKQGESYMGLKGSDKKLNLQQLHEQPQNKSKIEVYESRKPKRSEKTGKLCLSLGNVNAISSVKNTILVDKNNQQKFKFYKKEGEKFEMVSNELPIEMSYSLCLALLDFKVAIQ